MSHLEQLDLDALKASIKARKVVAFDYMIALSRMTPEELKYMGHTSELEGYLHMLKHTVSKIRKLTNAHLKKYPD